MCLARTPHSPGEGISYGCRCAHTPISTVALGPAIEISDHACAFPVPAAHSTVIFFFFNNPATPELYPLPLPDALPIYRRHRRLLPYWTYGCSRMPKWPAQPCQQLA